MTTHSQTRQAFRSVPEWLAPRYRRGRLVSPTGRRVDPTPFEILNDACGPLILGLVAGLATWGWQGGDVVSPAVLAAAAVVGVLVLIIALVRGRALDRALVKELRGYGFIDVGDYRVWALRYPYRARRSR